MLINQVKLKDFLNANWTFSDKININYLCESVDWIATDKLRGNEIKFHKDFNENGEVSFHSSLPHDFWKIRFDSTHELYPRDGG